MSFKDTPNYKDAIGFIVRVMPEYQAEANKFIIKKGSLIYGFYDNSETYGYLIDQDHPLDIPGNVEKSYVLLSKSGIWQCISGNYNNVRGLGANINGINWYTYNYNGENYALIAKIFGRTDARTIQGFVICDDPYWCEFEGVF